MSYRILIPQDVADIGKKYLRERGFEVIVTNRTDPESLYQDSANCDAILARLCPYPSDLFKRAPRLKCIARHGAGYDNIDIKAAEEAGVYVCITPGVTSNAVAEHVIMLLLSCARNIVVQDAELRSGNWNYRNQFKSLELYGKTLGIIGFGSIGRLVAQKAHYGLGMHVLAYGRHEPADTDYQNYADYSDNLDKVLKLSDVISVHIPSHPENIHFFGPEQFWKMKSGSIFLNTSRGSVVDENALYHALTDGTLYMAGLDVFESEPCRPDHPLLQLKNVIVTPHDASQTYETLDKMSLHAAMEIERVLTGQTPLWAVNHPSALKQ